MAKKMVAKRAGAQFIVWELNIQTTRCHDDHPSTPDSVQRNDTYHPLLTTHAAARQLIQKRKRELMCEKDDLGRRRPYKVNESDNRLERTRVDNEQDCTFTNHVTFYILTVAKIEHLGAG